ncbi:MAG: DUF6320 domain-containing protein, partial [Candidatus Weimeria sp.]
MSKKCIHCHITILDEKAQVCPLCNGVLSQDENEQIVKVNGYPDVTAARRRTTFFLRLLLTICVAGSFLCAAINFLNGGFPWAVIAVSSLIYIYIEFYLFFNPDVHIIAKIAVTILLALLFVVMIDVVTGFDKWSLNYCLPGALLLFNVLIIIMMFVNHSRWESYTWLPLLSIAFAILPIVFMHYDLVTDPVVSEVA